MSSDIVVSDIKMANMDGLTLLGEIKKIDAGVVFIMITGYPSIETVLEAMKKAPQIIWSNRFSLMK